jgi:hypothetical protein
MAMGISKEQNGADLCMGPLCIETGVTIDQGHITETTKVDVDYADMEALALEIPFER